MDKYKTIIIKAGILLVVAMVLFTMIRSFGTPPPPPPAAEAELVEVEYSQVLIASEDLPLGTRVDTNSFEWSPWPTEALTPSLITDVDKPEALEEYFNAIVRSGIVAGEPVNPAKLVIASGSGVMAALLNPGMRAVTTRISPDTAAGGFIQPGDRVDIVLTRTYNLEAGQAQPGQIINDSLTTSQTIFENVRVLAIDQTFSNSPEGGADIIGSTATFELNPVDVEILQEAESVGDLSLTLRGLTESNTYTASTANILRDVNPKSTASIAAGPAGQSLILYRSGQAQRVAIQGPN